MNAQPDRIIATLSSFLRDRKDEMVNRFIEAIRIDPEIASSEKLTRGRLVDHLPKLLDELCLLLIETNNEQQKAATATTSRLHGKYRWLDGYRLDELIKEIAILRKILLTEYVAAFSYQNRDFSTEAKSAAKYQIHEFFNNLIINSAQQYAEESEQAANRYRCQLEEANQQLAALDKSRLQLMRTVSHEMGNFLNAIVGAGSLLATNDDLATREKMYAMLKRNTVDMRLLLDQLLDYSVLLAGNAHTRTEAFEMKCHFDEIVHIFQPLAENKGLNFIYELDPALTIIVCDRLMNKQIVSNLLSNAIKYTREGEISLSVKSIEPERYSITVADTGVGIAPEHLPHIFNEFHRGGADPSTRGAGLGLAITKRLVELLKGELKVTSEAGKGSYFEVILPKIHYSA